MHAKAILVDKKYLFIWSENFSYFSLEKNRELWIILKDKKVILKFINIFNKDFSGK
jgi:phosphatidylserine/phosphatidylglycerophosphate/cardiolipin synthase-like enzyme